MFIDRLTCFSDVLVETTDCSLLTVTVKSKQHTYIHVSRRGIRTDADIAKERRFKLPSMSGVATKARVLLLHSGSIYLRRHNTARI